MRVSFRQYKPQWNHLSFAPGRTWITCSFSMWTRAVASRQSSFSLGPLPWQRYGFWSLALRLVLIDKFDKAPTRNNWLDFNQFYSLPSQVAIFGRFRPVPTVHLAPRYVRCWLQVEDFANCLGPRGLQQASILSLCHLVALRFHSFIFICMTMQSKKDPCIPLSTANVIWRTSGGQKQEGVR